jgi:hypothetical protein
MVRNQSNASTAAPTSSFASAESISNLLECVGVGVGDFADNAGLILVARSKQRDRSYLVTRIRVMIRDGQFWREILKS